MNSKQLETLIEDFFKTTNDIELYNEFSLQHELGIFLRKNIEGYEVQFERSIEFFGFSKKTNVLQKIHKTSNWVKKEIDIVVFNSTEKFAIELKFPPNYAPAAKRMWHFVTDVCFIEQLWKSGFNGGCAVTLVTAPKFHSGGITNTIHKYFRTKSPIQGKIFNPESKSKFIIIEDSYVAKWEDTQITNRKLWNAPVKTIDAKYYIITI